MHGIVKSVSLKSLILSCAVALCLVAFSPTFASGDESALLTEEQKNASSIRIERVSVNLPEVKAYIQLDNGAAFDAEDVTATLSGKTLETDSLLGMEEAGEGTTYFFLVDCSTSIYPSDMDGIKDMLIAFASQKGERDKLVLISFGERVEMLLDGSEDAQTAAGRIETLSPTQNATLFNDAVIVALDQAGIQQGSLPERKVVVVVSDGTNYDEAAGSTEQELLDRLDTASAPLYALCLESADPYADPRAFGQLARKSGGDIRMADGSNIAGEFAAMNDYIAAIKVLVLEAPDNIVEAPEQVFGIAVALGDRVITNGGSRNVSVTSHIPDVTAPEITGVEQLDDVRIRVSFSERVDGADTTGAYIVKDADNLAIGVQNVVCGEADDTFTADITLEGRPYSGTYTLETAGITDRSMEKNAIGNSLSFEFEGQHIAMKYLRIALFDYWWAILVVVIIVILLIVFRVLRKRKGLVKVDGKIGFGDAVEFKHHFETPKSRYLRLLVVDGKGMGTQVDLDVESSVFIGRAKTNNLSFDDTKMSRQHFVIETAEDGFYVTDLESANGTFVNDERLKGKRLLEEGDTITAGHEKFIFRGTGDAAGASGTNVR